MKKNNKKMLSIIIAAMICLAAVTGCGSKSTAVSETGSQNQETAVNTETAEEITLNFWHNYSAESAENETLTTVLIPEFESKNPGIKVNAVSYEWADLHDKILISAQSNTLPDVARLDIAWIPEFEKSNILVPLNTEMNNFSSVSEKLLPSAMSTANVGNNVYGLALNTNTKILYYSVDAFNEAGLSVPTTMDEFVEAIKTLAGYNANGQQVWGYEEPALAGWNVCPFIWSMGGSLTDDAQKVASGYINGSATVNAVTILKELYDVGAITGWNSGDIPMTDGFGTGRYAMILEGPWKVAEMRGAYPDFNYATTEIPAGKGGSISVLGGEDICMFDSANKDAAWKFMQFMTDEFAQEEMAKCGQIPVNLSAMESNTAKAADFAPYLEAIDTAKARPTVACWSEMDNELGVALSSIMNDEKSVQDALDELAQKWDALLSE